jgi:large-conductance mechanosensitive channel
MVRGAPISYGPFLGHVVTFILSMLLVFFIFIKPFKVVIEKSKQEEKSQTELSRVDMHKAIKSLQNIEVMLSSSSQRLRL